VMTSTTSSQFATPSNPALAVSDVVSTAKEQAASIADASKHEARAVTRDAKEHTKEVLNQSREQLRRQADEQFRSLAETLGDIGRQLSGLANGDPQEGVAADLASDLASHVTRLGERAQQGGLDGALRDVKQFARRRPTVFLLAALGGGVVAGRVVRASDSHALVEAVKADGDDSETGPAPADGLTTAGGYTRAGVAMPIVSAQIERSEASGDGL